MRKETREEKVYRIWNYIRLMLVLLFAMAAGAACYNQYLMQQKPVPVRKTETYRYIESNYTQNTLIQTQVMEECKPVQEEEEQSYYFTSMELFARCVEAEAGNQGMLGKRMVACVILNRVEDKDWPDTIVGVITKPYEFTTWWDGAIERAEPTEETYEAIRLEMEERSYPGLFYFCSTGYSEYGTPWKKVGDHYFSTK